ncbi:hypothetical protein IQ07DRAFT_640232 [Pyrenochaeta sp. DS3sAY3a]|nr:hypothetical protein IQ07DRAFT_640232 [Pyrenochaeta sp. DS3sAY3a]
MKRNIVIFLIILILFFLIALIAYLIYYLQTRMAVGGTASSVSDMTESRVAVAASVTRSSRGNHTSEDDSFEEEESLGSRHLIFNTGLTGARC